MAGFHWVGSQTGGELSGKVKMFSVASSHAAVLGPGDVVLMTGSSDADGMAYVDTGTANTGNTGVVTGVPPQVASEALSQTWLSASTAGYVWVNVDPLALWSVEVANGPLVAADVGLNVPLVATTGTVNGSLFTSNMKVNATGKNTTNTLPFQVVALQVGDDGVLGSRALVRTNAATNAYGATGV